MLSSGGTNRLQGLVVTGIRLAFRSANRESPKVQRRKLRSNLSRLGEHVVGRTIPELGPQRDLMLLPETVEPQPKTGNVWTRFVMIDLEAGHNDTVRPRTFAIRTWRVIVGRRGGREHGASPGPKHPPELPQRCVAVRCKGQRINARNAVGRGIRKPRRVERCDAKLGRHCKRETLGGARCESDSLW